MAQIGNQNARRGTQFRDALHKVAVRHGNPDFDDWKPTGYEAIVRVLWLKALDGDIAAIKEIADRTDGKSVQSIEAEVHAVSHEAFLDECQEPD